MDSRRERTREQVERFEAAIRNAEQNPPLTVHPTLRQAILDGLKSQLADLKAEVQAYENEQTKHS
jgi:hypothetical protein